MTEEQAEKFTEAYEKLTSAINAVAGCMMFAPDHLKLKDGPRLSEEMQQAAFECDQVVSEITEL
jgi:hypothetical protein